MIFPGQLHQKIKALGAGIPAAWVAVSLRDGKIKLVRWLRIGVPALIVGGFWYVWNLVHLGSLDTTRYLTAQYPDIVPAVFGFQFAERGMTTVSDLLIFGLAGPFTRISQFGAAYWIGAISLVICLFLFKDNRLVRASGGICLVYLAFHLTPLQHHISWLSPRYPLTVLPLVLIGSSPLFRRKGFTTALITATIAAGVLAIGLNNPYFREPDHYGKMRAIVDREISVKDKVLVVHTPYFFIDNPQADGLDSIDPRLANLYQMPSLDNVLRELQGDGFTHILMPWTPTPFETMSFVRQLFTVEGLVESIAATRSFYLYRLHYPDGPLPKYQQFRILNWPIKDSSVPAVAYANAKDRLPPRIWTTPVSVQGFSVETGSTIALASSALWNRSAGIFNVSDARYVRIRMHLRDTPVPCLIHPVIATYDDTGNRLALLHPLEFRSSPGWVTLQYATAYPGFKTEMIPLQSGCSSIAVGFNYFREAGGLAFDGLEIDGFHP